MKTWDCIENKEVDTPTEMEVFLNDIVDVYKKHGLSLSHEDYHGAFRVTTYDEENVEWLKAAQKWY